MMNRVTVSFVFLVISLADFTTVEYSSKSNKSIVSDDIEKSGRILNDIYNSFNYLTGNVARLLLPIMLKITQEVNVSRSCVRGGMRFLGDLKQNKGWTLKLMDSLGKPMGLFSGNQWLHGDYDQCLNIEVKDDKIRNYNKNLNTIYGEFCALTIGFNSYQFNEVPEDNKTRKMFRMFEEIFKPFLLSNIFESLSYKKAGYRVDICIPSTCDREDIENILQWSLQLVFNEFHNL
ncbi:uncharacterized protein [Centruroides vittatus]|uniref:uncharacterized protein n=1 Tax=Centruroides vittatus TaxID=120091 RepID=UPI00350F8C3A